MYSATKLEINEEYRYISSFRLNVNEWNQVKEIKNVTEKDD